MSEREKPHILKTYRLEELVSQIMDFRGRTPLKLGMEWGGGDIRALSANNVQMGKVDFAKESYFGSETLYRRWMTKGDCKKGDVLLTTEAPLGNVAQVPDDKKYILSQRTILLKTEPTKAFPDYLFQLFRSEPFQTALAANSTGSTVVGIQVSKLSKIEAAVPSVRVQRKIAQILTTVDNLIEKTEALIAKYQVIKRGMMHDLFTRGVNEHGQLRSPYEEAPEMYKQSELGWIPNDWEVRRVDEAGSVKLGRQRSPRHQSGKFTTPYLRVANVFDGWIDYSDVLEMDFTPSERDTFSVHNRDILLNEGQSLELVGRSAIYLGEPNRFCFQNTLIRFRAFALNSPTYCRGIFKYWLDVGRFITVARQTTSVAHLGADRFASMQFPLPQPEEQMRIASRLLAQDRQNESNEKYLDNLSKIKTGLMQDLLSGKVRVKVDETEAGGHV